jgi:hypothetical protein
MIMTIYLDRNDSHMIVKLHTINYHTELHYGLDKKHYL